MELSNRSRQGLIAKTAVGIEEQPDLGIDVEDLMVADISDKAIEDKNEPELCVESTEQKASAGVSRSKTKLLKDSILEQQERDNAIFRMHEDEFMYSKTSLICRLSAQNRLRRAAVWLETWRWFKHFITFAILLNSLLLATTDYEKRLDPEHESWWAPIQKTIDVGFSIIFIFESIIKVIAMGFVVHKHSYLRIGWNILDFSIVVVSVISMLPMGAGSSLKGLRTFRILRPLRSVNNLPALRLQFETLIKALPGIFRSLLFIIFIFTLFAIFGTNQFQGQQYSFCRSQADAVYDVDGKFLKWPKSGEDSNKIMLCEIDEQCEKMFKEDDVAICGTVYKEFGKDPWEYDGVREIELIMYGIPGFDNVAQAFLTIFQTLTLESWVNLMYNYSDTGNQLIASLFFFFVVLIGTFFTMNLVIASIVEAYQEVNEKTNQNKIKNQDDSVILTDLEKNEELVHSLKVDPKGKLAHKISKSGQIARQMTKDAEAKLINKKEEHTGLKIYQEGNEMKIADSVEKVEDLNDQEFEMEPSQRNLLLFSSLTATKSKKTERGDAQNTNYVLRSSVEDEKKDEFEQVTQKKNTPMGSESAELEDMFEFDQDYLKAADTRSAQNGLYSCCYALVTSLPFKVIIFLLIIGNTVTLSLYHYDQSQLKTTILLICNEIFTWLFFAELIVKLIGLGPKNYIKDHYNVFDAIIVIVSLVDWAITKIPDLNSGPVLNGFRALRLLRVFRLAQTVKLMQSMLVKMAKSMKDISHFSLLLFLSMYMFALLGMDLFANKGLLDSDDNLVVGEENIQALFKSGDYYSFPVDNFNNIGRALTTIFIVLVGEDWNWTMYQWVRAVGSTSNSDYFIAVLFFLLVMILGNIILFSLFTAILLQNFEGGDESEDEDKEDEQESSLSVIQQLSISFGGKKKTKMFKQVLDVDGKPKSSKLGKTDKGKKKQKKQLTMRQIAVNGEDREQQKKLEREDAHNIKALIHYKKMEREEQKSLQKTKDFESLPDPMGLSLFCLRPTNPFRLAVYRMVESNYFKNTILFLIIVSTVTLALESPLDNPKGDKMHVLKTIELITTIAFTIEVVVKVIATGFAFAGKNSYIREFSNILDFLIVVAALLDIGFGDSMDVGFYKALRILKILRPLRMITHHKGLKISIITIIKAIPNIIRLTVLVYFFIFLFAILMTMLFSGSFASCHMDHLQLNKRQQINNIETMWDCINYGGEWATPDFNFDTTFDSMLTLLSIQSTEGWIGVMFGAVDAVRPLYQPKQNHNLFYIPVMILLIVILCILFIELSVGVVIETFNSQKEVLLGNRDLARSQIGYARIHLLAMKMEPKLRQQSSQSKLRNLAIKLTKHPRFDDFIMLCIVLNTIVLGLSWYMQDEQVMHVREMINYFFMVVFTVEAILKIIAQKFDYFKDSWNIFDFIIVVFTIIILCLNWIGVANKIKLIGVVLLSLRTARIFRLLHKYKNLHDIYETLLEATPAMGALGLLLMLFIFMFAIIGMSLFALVDIKDASEMNRHVNFQQFVPAFLTLLRCSTGEAWNVIMFDTARHHSVLYQCNEQETYDTIVADNRDPNEPLDPEGCGSAISFPFHLAFQLVVSQVFLNLFIAIMIDTFFGQTDIQNMAIQSESLEAFKEYWSYYDPKATGFISIRDLKELFNNLGEAPKERGGALIPSKKRFKLNQKNTYGFISDLGIPTYGNMQYVMFHDVLIKLCYRATRKYFMRESFKTMHYQCKLLREHGYLVDDNAMAILYDMNVSPKSFDAEFNELLVKIDEPNPKAELIQQMVKLAQELKNQKDVDTQKKIVGVVEVGDVIEKVYIYTTAQVGSAHQINELIINYLKRTKSQ